MSPLLSSLAVALASAALAGTANATSLASSRCSSARAPLDSMNGRVSQCDESLFLTGPPRQRVIPITA